MPKVLKPGTFVRLNESLRKECQIKDYGIGIVARAATEEDIKRYKVSLVQCKTWYLILFPDDLDLWGDMWLEEYQDEGTP